MRSNGIFFFQHDLRLSDNPALLAVVQRCDQLLCVYLVHQLTLRDTQWQPQHRQNGALSAQRQLFLYQSLQDLDRQLTSHGQALHLCVTADPVDTMDELMGYVQPTVVGMSRHAGVNETTQLTALKRLARNHASECIEGPPSTLFNDDDLPFALDDMPNVFSPFRRKIEKSLTPNQVVDAPASLKPKVPDFDYCSYESIGLSTAHGKQHFPRLIGGETAALAQLDYYTFKCDALASYKETRNGLDGWDFSSKLSAWLAHGCISPRQVYQTIGAYEKERVKNDSTYWLYFELLWREFFHWQLTKHGAAFFQFGGIQQSPPTTRHDHERFTRWCDGDTGYPIVDACMRQLNTTGFMSNRGRQLVASCFVHELNLDWRYGAAYFEKQLVDYDVASNWGNWQYLAGVGSDPRGHRQFNLEKQTQTYDPDRQFIQRWLDDAS
ncbi:DASH family cryptochrome [Alteromonas oceanisediminis]|uniref:DASH family cryptochrome n=1 Tax=Alteromonas oceanisediminis TaxID=2836180 RepID=UPI001BD9E703|nr:DASH family cryptochrome [Alteromonas oceanisediminis]MBT0587105.1 DASH family cryptochrome [Alteromonas oceanisediminis]